MGFAGELMDTNGWRDYCYLFTADSADFHRLGCATTGGTSLRSLGGPDCHGWMTAGGRFPQISAGALMIFVMDVVHRSENAMRFTAMMRDR